MEARKNINLLEESDEDDLNGILLMIKIMDKRR